MLIVTEHALAYDEPGKACHFDLLPIPWDKEAFRKCVSYTMEVDQQSVEIQELDPETNPVGVRCWVCYPPNCRPLELLYEQHTIRRCAIAGRIIDRIAATKAPLLFPWPKDKPFDDPETMETLEQQLFLKHEIPVEPR